MSNNSYKDDPDFADFNMPSYESYEGNHTLSQTMPDANGDQIGAGCVVSDAGTSGQYVGSTV
jgi:hypothetical protein